MLPPYSTDATMLKTGVYQHYSGKQYEVVGVGRHSETYEEVVIYPLAPKNSALIGPR